MTEVGGNVPAKVNILQIKMDTSTRTGFWVPVIITSSGGLCKQ